MSNRIGFESISAESLKQRMESKGCVLIDVRTPGEFHGLHVRGAVNLPLDRLTAEQVQSNCSDSNTSAFILCQGGNRSRMACQKLAESGCSAINVEGGTTACVAAGLPIDRAKGVIGLERQVRIAAGSLVCLGIALGAFVHPASYFLSAFIGAGLVFAGVTDTCGMGMLIAKMPWNQTKSTVQ